MVKKQENKLMYLNYWQTPPFLQKKHEYQKF